MARLPFDPKNTAAAKAVRTPAVAGQYGAPVRTVRQINAMVGQALLANLPGVVAVQGEISNFRVYDRGHAFFTLKEPGAEIPCMMWRDDLVRLKFSPKDGLAVIARGAVKMYEAQGKVQLYVDALFPQGMGGLELAFRQLCEKLKAEGLFEAARKKAIPRFPRRVAIITSRTGDVLHDVLTTAYRRMPGLHTMLFPVTVQGAAAAPAIVQAIELLNGAEHLQIDLILLVRGGGSLEDLWAFNEEIVARAMVASRIPIATGIGHEPDTTVADLVGDLRGPTPTGVTELTIPSADALHQEVTNLANLLTRDFRRLRETARGNLRNLSLELAQAMRAALRKKQEAIERLSRGIARIEPRHAIAQGWRRVEEAQRRLEKAHRRHLAACSARLSSAQFRLEKNHPAIGLQRASDHVGHLAGKLQRAVATRRTMSAAALNAAESQLRIVSPQAVLERGYSITMTPAGKILRKKNDAAPGDVIITRLSDGAIKSTVGEPRQGKLF